MALWSLVWDLARDRRNRNRRFVNFDPTAPESEWLGAVIDAEQDAIDLRLLTEEALSLLSPVQRRVIELRMEGYQIASSDRREKTVASLLRLSENMAYKHFQAAKHVLADSLDMPVKRKPRNERGDVDGGAT